MQIVRRRVQRATGTFLSVTGALSIGLMTAIHASQAKPPAPAAKASPESIANGETLYKRQCQVCHGATGMGNGPAAKQLKGKLPNLADKATLAKVTDAQITELLTEGKKSEIGNMPSFKTKLKPEEMQDVINFVHTLAK